MEPINVSKPELRQPEPATRNLGWGQLSQGMPSMGSGEMESFWDKALAGAQKLFGIERKPSGLEPKEKIQLDDSIQPKEAKRDSARDLEDEDGEESSRAANRGHELPVVQPTILQSRPIQRSVTLPVAASDSRPEAVPVTASAARGASSLEATTSEKALPMNPQGNAYGLASEGKPALVATRGFAQVEAAKTAPQAGVSLPQQRGQAAKDNLLNVDSKLVKESEAQVGIGNALKTPASETNSMPILAKDIASPDAKAPAQGSESRALASVSTPATTAPKGDGAMSDKAVSKGSATQQGASESSALKDQPSSSYQETAKPRQGLEIEAPARESKPRAEGQISELPKQADRAQQAVARAGAIQVAPKAKAGQASLVEADAKPVTNGEREAPSASSKEAPKGAPQANAKTGEMANREFIAQQLSEKGAASAKSQPAPAPEAREPAILNNLARPGVSMRGGQHTTSISSNGNNVLQGIATASEAKGQSGAQSQSQNSGQGNSAGQDAKASAPAAKSADAPQALANQANASRSSESSSSQAASKASASSYLSKTSQEVKDVYAALTRSLERMSSLKQNTFTIRVQFDQGGSLAMKISMNNGQAVTMMQTDLPGLESLIKSNWGELANEWNQRGVKLSDPQFSQRDWDGNRQDGAKQFDQNADRQGQASQSNGREQGQAQSSSSRRSANEATSEASDSTPAESVEEDSEQELKAYA